MNRNKYKSLYTVLSIAPLLAILNFFILNFLIPNKDAVPFHYSLITLYMFFTATSLLILFILIKIKDKHPEQIGYVFLLATSLKMGLCFALLYPILDIQSENVYFEKINFFAIFILFLAMEVVLTARILSQEDKKG